MAEKGSEEIIPHLDPWSPRPTANTGTIPPPNDDKDTGLSSEEYIALLEAKLQRLKGRKNREPSSKDIIDGLSQAKAVQMKDTVEESYTQQSNYEDQGYSLYSGDDREDTRLAALQRRLQPEQALSAEELKQLVENDELAKLILDLREAEAEEQEKRSGSDGGGVGGGGGGDAALSGR